MRLHTSVAFSFKEKVVDLRSCYPPVLQEVFLMGTPVATLGIQKVRQGDHCTPPTASKDVGAMTAIGQHASEEIKAKV